MMGEVFNPGEPLRRQELDYIQNSAQAELRERTMDTFSPGILADSQIVGEAAPFSIEPDGGYTVRVRTGRAIGSHDVDPVDVINAADTTKTGGERTLITAADAASGNYSRSVGAGPGTGTGTGPFHESSNGLGGWTSTPQSTGTRQIPVVNGQLNRVWIAYLNAIDFSVTLTHKVNTSQLLYPRRTDGYDIVVNQSGTPPSGDLKYEFLGTVDLTASPVSVSSGNISLSNRRFARTRPKRVGVSLDPSLSPITYDNTPRTISAEDHVNGFGTGTVTPENVHGLKFPDDFGVTVDVDTTRHRKKEHTPGLLVPDTTSITSALYPVEAAVSPVPLDPASIIMFPLGVNETIDVAGMIFSSVSPQTVSVISTLAGPAPIGSAYVSFPSSTATGTYNIVLGVLAGVLTASKRLSSLPVDLEAEYLVGTVGWDNGSGFFNTAVTDQRLFGTVANRNIQYNAVQTPNIKDLNVTTTKLADQAVTTAKQGDLSITTGKLVDQSVTTAKIADLNVTTGKLAAQAVTAAKIANNTITATQIAPATITATELANNSVGTNALVDTGVTAGTYGDPTASTWPRIVVDADGRITSASNASVSPVVQFVVSANSSLINGGNVTIPIDDTIPQNTEGFEFLSVAITPKSTTNRLLIQANLQLGIGNNNSPYVLALFKSGSTDAIAANVGFLNSSAGRPVAIQHTMVAGTTSSITFSVRAASNAGSTIYLNSNGSATRVFGGVSASEITVTEIAA